MFTILPGASDVEALLPHAWRRACRILTRGSEAELEAYLANETAKNQQQRMAVGMQWNPLYSACHPRQWKHRKNAVRAVGRYCEHIMLGSTEGETNDSPLFLHVSARFYRYNNSSKRRPLILN
jgi:hypothetical protein